MANFTVNPFLYLLFHQSQQHRRLNIKPGVPVLDRDLNLLGELSSLWIRQAISEYLGYGVKGESDDSFRVVPGEPTMSNDFFVKAGSVLLDGGVITNGSDLRYSSQAGATTLTTPVGAQRTDIVYLDVWLEDVEGTAYDQMVAQFLTDNSINLNDVGLQTAVPQKLQWAVRVDENSTALPPNGSGTPLYGHLLLPLASLSRPSGEAGISANLITDLRPKLLLHERFNVLESKALKPAFASSPFAQLERSYTRVVDGLTIYGRNFHMDGFSIELVPVGGGSSISMPISGHPSATEATFNFFYVSGTTAGTNYFVKVTTEFGTVTSTEQFTLFGETGEPYFSSTTPVTPSTQARGGTITLSGYALNANPAVTLGFTNVPPENITSMSYTSITLTIPTYAATGLKDITITTAYGSVTVTNAINIT